MDTIELINQPSSTAVATTIFNNLKSEKDNIEKMKTLSIYHFGNKIDCIYAFNEEDMRLFVVVDSVSGHSCLLCDLAAAAKNKKFAIVPNVTSNDGLFKFEAANTSQNALNFNVKSFESNANLEEHFKKVAHYVIDFDSNRPGTFYSSGNGFYGRLSSLHTNTDFT